MHPDRVGPYEVLRKLGTGGMGSVYLALDEDGHTVAVKVIHPHVAEDVNGLRRLAREVGAMKRVASPYVAELLDADLDADPAYIVTRYVQGLSLQEVVERRGPLAGKPLWSLGEGLVTALDAIHGVGVVHRDLTPRNVMMADGVPTVIDFGIAQALDATRITQTLIGTPGFVAPEVMRGERAGPQADVFSWAATMVFAATGHKCFEGRNFLETLHRTLAKDPDLSGVPRELTTILGRCLHKDPGQRPPISALIAGIVTLTPDGPRPVPSQRQTAAGRVTDLWSAAGQAREKGELARAEKLYGEVRHMAVKAKDPASEMFATYQLAAAAEIRHDYGAAREFYARVQDIARSLRSATIEAQALQGLERLARMADDPNLARAYAEQARRVVADKHTQGEADGEPLLRPWTP